MHSARREQHVCIIGAGSSGLTAAKTLHERGISFVCLEKGSGVGGLWRYNNDSGLSPAYRSLHINTSRKVTGYVDYPLPASYPDFPHHSLMLKYFEDYTDHFGFRHKIRFQTDVLRVEPQSEGGFLVYSRNAAGAVQQEFFSAVLVANGHHWKPRYPQFPGEFTNPTLHSKDYRTPDAMVGKRILVVGIGNSGCDIACECARVAEHVYLATRRGAHIIPKYMFGRPLDRVVPRWIWVYTPFPIFQWLFGVALRLARGRLSTYGLPEPEHRILEEHPAISADLLNLIGHGAITVKPNVAELLGEEVRFSDGTQVPIDVLIYATGYDISIPFLDEQILDTRDNQVRLYKRVIHPDYPGLYFIGLVQPWGSMFRLAEAQGKWVADLLEGKCGLPSREAMWADIEQEHQRNLRRYTRSPRHTIQVDFYRHLAELNRERQRRPRRDSSRRIAGWLLRRQAA